MAILEFQIEKKINLSVVSDYMRTHFSVWAILTVLSSFKQF